MIPDEITLQFEHDGFVLLPGVFTREENDQLLAGLESVLSHDREDSALRNRTGTIFAARNVLELYPETETLWRKPVLTSFLEKILGTQFGLVRALYFDKPPGLTWGLPWHKDLTIAIEPPASFPAHVPEGHWRKLTHKAGVPHVEADCSTLRKMITLRIHLDPASEENGALRIVPRSHHSGKQLDLSQPEYLAVAQAGDVLAMSPLLSHCSGRSTDGTTMHRRILHLEFSGVEQLPFGFRWQNFSSIVMATYGRLVLGPEGVFQMSPQKQTRVLIGAIAGAALGALQIRNQNYDFSDSAGVSQAIGFMLGFVGIGALIGWVSGPKEEE